MEKMILILPNFFSVMPFFFKEQIIKEGCLISKPRNLTLSFFKCLIRAFWFEKSRSNLILRKLETSFFISKHSFFVPQMKMMKSSTYLT